MSVKVKDTKKKNNNKSKKDDWKIFILKRMIPLICIFGAIIVVVYFCFLPEKWIPLGEDLLKSDWLAFLGAYLSFAGATVVSLFVFWHTSYISRKEEKKAEEERKKKVQPIFSVNILSVNGMVHGTAEAITWNGSYQNRHQNMLISIENVNEYPIKHVIVYDKYLCPLLKTGVSMEIQCAYAGSYDANKYPDIVAVITEDVYEKNEEGLPQWFNINYEDVDGREMYQTFQLKKFDNTMYFSLEGVSDV